MTKGTKYEAGTKQPDILQTETEDVKNYGARTRQTNCIQNGAEGAIKQIDIMQDKTEGIKNVVQPARYTIPYHYQERLATHLRKLEAVGVAEGVNPVEPNEYNAILEKKMQGSIHMNIDARPCNKGAKHTRYLQDENEGDKNYEDETKKINFLQVETEDAKHKEASSTRPRPSVARTTRSRRRLTSTRPRKMSLSTRPGRSRMTSSRTRPREPNTRPRPRVARTTRSRPTGSRPRPGASRTSRSWGGEDDKGDEKAGDVIFTDQYRCFIITDQYR